MMSVIFLGFYPPSEVAVMIPRLAICDMLFGPPPAPFVNHNRVLKGYLKDEGFCCQKVQRLLTACILWYFLLGQNNANAR